MDQVQSLSRRDMWQHMLLYPGHTLPIAAAPVIVAVGLAIHYGTFAAVPALFAFFAGWLIQLGGVLTDNYENLTRHPNDREHPELVQGLRNGALTLSGLKTAIYACYLLALLAGVFLISVAGIPVLVIGLLSIGASWIYAAGPFPFGERGLADPLFFAFFGAVSVAGSYYVQAAPTYGMDTSSFWQFLPQALPLSVFLISLPVGALTTNILIIDDIRDREFDAEKGKRTVTVRFGKEWSRVEFVGFLVLAYLAPVLFWLALAFSAWVLLPLLTLPFAIATARAVLTLDQFQELVPITPQAARLLLTYAVLLTIGVAPV
ncbi:MAG: 1,4-dihydroxy-2-naphthoate octaprenyltransferase [Acidobacteria bacterium]|nr:1,4-dihydroxy-2-naphthoate octaprenyltransferase [Acidobacteriota bacterium]